MKILAKVSYLGTNFKGWQKQDNTRTVQEEIEKCLSKILDSDICIYGSGRTDSGVHALGQTFHFEIEKDIDLDRLVYSLNMILPNDIHIISMVPVDDDFHARYSAKGKHYCFKINTDKNDPFLEGRVVNFPYKIDVRNLEKLLQKFIGKHNYQDFTSKEEDEDDFVRTIESINVKEEKNIIEIHFIGNGFMRYMIRYIVGTVLECIRGKIDESFIDEHLDSKTRKIVSYKADGEGLYLIDVIY